MSRSNLALAAVIIALLTAPMAVMAVTSSGTYADMFDHEKGYFGNDGSLDWNGGWWDLESGVYGQNSTGGRVFIDEDDLCNSGRCLEIENGGLLPLGGITAGAKRQADTSRFETTALHYRVGARSVLGITGSLAVQVSVDGGKTWATRRTYLVATLIGGPYQKSVDLSAYASEKLEVQFLVTGLLGGSVLIDEVEIVGEVESTSSTTSTTSTSTTTTTLISTTLPTVPTTTIHETTTTTRPTTTTTADSRPTTTTTAPEPPTTQDRDTTSTTTTAPTTTTTTNDDDRSIVASGPGEPPAGGGFDDAGLHQSARGIQAGLNGAMFADVSMVPMFDPVDVDFSFGLVTEEIETSWIWMTLFGLVLTWALVSILDRKRFNRLPQPASSPAVS